MLCDDEWDKLKYKSGTINGEIATRKKAKESMKLLLGKTISSKDGIETKLSSNNIGKILSSVSIAASKGNNDFTAEQHLAAAADIENLFRNSTKILTHPDKDGDPNIKCMHRFVAPLYGDNIAFITVKEATIEGKKIYSIQLIKLEELEGKLGRIKTTPPTATNFLQ